MAIDSNEIIEQLVDVLNRAQATRSDDLYGDCYLSKVPLEQAAMLMAHLWALMRSKDPNTKVGAVVYDRYTGSMHFGYNGFNEGVPDEKRIWDNRELQQHPNKYDRVVHAECNAISKAKLSNYNPEHSVLFVTNWPCHHCVKDHIIPSKIRSIVYLDDYPPDIESKNLLDYADVKYERIDLKF